jgi:hypothetical protein
VRIIEGPVQDHSRLYGTVVRRFLVIAAVAFWLGGFTFYAGVAIPMGVEVLGTHRAVGFITERVTNWLNVGGGAALLILLWNLRADWPKAGKWLRRLLLGTWVLMACIELELVSLHPVMDHLLRTNPRQILNEDRFDLLHHVYLISTTVQWMLGVLHVWCVAVVWTGATVLRPGYTSDDVVEFRSATDPAGATDGAAV